MTTPTTTQTPLARYIGTGGGLAAKHVLERGRPYKVIRNDKLDFGPAKNCYGNAALVALYNDEYTYVEGWATGIIPVHHAWVEDADGNAIDVTLRFDSDICPHCGGEGRRPLADHTDCEDCDGDGPDWGCEADELCEYIDGVRAGCLGTGKSDLNLDWDPDREYIGVAVPTDLLRKVLLQTGTYGVLDKPLYYELAGAL